MPKQSDYNIVSSLLFSWKITQSHLWIGNQSYLEMTQRSALAFKHLWLHSAGLIDDVIIVHTKWSESHKILGQAPVPLLQPFQRLIQHSVAAQKPKRYVMHSSQL